MATQPISYAGQLSTVEVWQTLLQMLRDQLGSQNPPVDVQAISDKDFNTAGEIIMNPPSVRIFFAGESASAIETQKLNYDAVGRYIVACADQDLRSTQDQALASALLAVKVKAILVGARINLASGDQSEPVAWISTEPMPVVGLGMAYALGIEVPGIAQFPGTNATGYGMTAAEEAAQDVEA